MKHRKCDTAKYRRRKKKEQANRRERLGTATPAEQGSIIMQAAATQKPARPVCPLCNQVITVEDAVKRNVHSINFNRRPTLVHKVCPEEGKRI